MTADTTSDTTTSKADNSSPSTTTHDNNNISAPKLHTSDNEPLSAKERKKCLATRTVFFKCLDKHEIGIEFEADEVAEGRVHCPNELLDYETYCPRVWRQHYMNLRRRDKKILAVARHEFQTTGQKMDIPEDVKF